MYSQVHVQVKHVLKQGFLTLRKQKREKVGGRLCWREGANGYEPVKVSGQGEKHVDSDDRFILANVHKGCPPRRHKISPNTGKLRW